MWTDPICSERPDNPGTSITNAAELIADEIWARYDRPSRLTWIEHYPPPVNVRPGHAHPADREGTYDVVRFTVALGPAFDLRRFTPGPRLVDPDWRYLSSPEWADLSALLRSEGEGWDAGRRQSVPLARSADAASSLEFPR